MQDYRRYDRSDPAEPWWALVPDASDRRLHARALRLSQFRRELAAGRRGPERRGWRAWRERALANWRAYLETGHAD